LMAFFASGRLMRTTWTPLWCSTTMLMPCSLVKFGHYNDPWAAPSPDVGCKARR
jgi:hypothetical protein